MAVPSSAVSLPHVGHQAARPAVAAASKPANPYIVAPAYDWLLFLLPPSAALILGLWISSSRWVDTVVEFHRQEMPLPALAIGILTHAHLVIVLFRSHGNPDIFREHRVRFLVVPPVLYLLLISSPWLLVGASVVITFWDVYHSGAQTFGLARIYDRKCGNDPDVGRNLDWWLSQILYAGPIIGGATMMDHFEDFLDFQMVGDTFFTAVPAFMEGHHRTFTYVVLAIATGFVAYYLFAYWRLAQRGYQVSRLKVFLLATTSICSVFTWGFNPFGQAFFIMNFFHAIQYFGIVWAFEKTHMARLFGFDGWRLATPLTLILFLGVGFTYGYWVLSLDSSIQWLWGVTLVVSILHFWYDGFIWSVRKRQV